MPVRALDNPAKPWYDIVRIEVKTMRNPNVRILLIAVILIGISYKLADKFANYRIF